MASRVTAADEEAAPSSPRARGVLDSRRRGNDTVAPPPHRASTNVKSGIVLGRLITGCWLPGEVLHALDDVIVEAGDRDPAVVRRVGLAIQALDQNQQERAVAPFGPLLRNFRALAPCRRTRRRTASTRQRSAPQYEWRTAKLRGIIFAPVGD